MKRFAPALFAILIFLGTYAFFIFSKPTGSPVTEPPVATAEEPKKVDFGKNMPEEFLDTLPLEESREVKQSYGLYYPRERQSTYVFASKKSVADNAKLYADFLRKERFVIMNREATTDRSFFYAVGQSTEINVTVSKDVSNPDQSEVSISVLQK